MNDHAIIDSARRRKLDELFEDQPFLSTTMRANQLHTRLTEATPLNIPVLAHNAEEDFQRLMEARHAQLASWASNKKAETGRTFLPIPVESSRSADNPSRITIPLPSAKTPSAPEGVDLKLHLWVDTSVSPPQVHTALRSPEAETEVMTLSEAASFLRFSPGTLRKLIRQKGLPCARVGRSLRFRRTALLEWLEKTE